MPDRKRNRPEAGRRSATLDHEPDPGVGDPVEEMKLPPHNPTRGRTIQDPKPRTRKRADDIESPEDDDTSGEMASAGQDLGVGVDEREAASVEDPGAGDEDEESDGLDRDDRTDRGRGQLD